MNVSFSALCTPAHRPSALLTVDRDDGLDELARGDVVAGMPVDFREPGDTEFLGDRLSGTRAGDATAHGLERLPYEHLALESELTG